MTKCLSPFLLAVYVGVLLYAATSVDAQAQNLSEPGAATTYLIETSYTLDGEEVDCPSLTYAECNATLACWYNESDPSSVCASRGSLTYNGTGNITSDRPWCYNHFPIPFIASVYLIAAFVSGFALAGSLYNAIWYDTYSRINDVGERQFNQFYYSTTPINLYCITLVVTAIIMASLSVYNLSNEYDCSYVAFVYMYLIVVLVPGIGYPSYKLALYIKKHCMGGVQTAHTVDDFCMPPTAPAIADPLINQVRSF